MSQHSHVCTRASMFLQLSRVATQTLCEGGRSLFLGLTCRHSNVERQLQTGPQSLGNGAGQMVISRVRMKVNQLPVSLPLQSISVSFNQQRAERRESSAVIKPTPPRMRADHREKEAQKNSHNTHTQIEIQPQLEKRAASVCEGCAKRSWVTPVKKIQHLIPNVTSFNVPLQNAQQNS